MSSSASQDGAILYACVAKAGNVLLAECVLRPSSNVAPMVRGQILPKLTADPAGLSADKKVSYSGDGYLVHVLQRSKLVFICVTDKSYANYMAFKYLEKAGTNFVAFYRDDSHRTPQACQAFSRQLKQEGDFFNSPDANKLKKIQTDIDQVRNVMVDNLDTIIQRGDKIENLVEKTNLLLGESTTFVSNSTSLRRKMWLKNVKLIAIIVFLLLGIITVILLIACQGFKKGNRCS